MITHIFKHRRRINGKSVSSRLWSGRYKLDGDSKTVTVALKTADKQVAEAKLREIVSRKQKEQCGLVPTSSVEQAIQKPLADHLADFIIDRERLGRSPDYIRQLKGKNHRLITECGWKRAVDISAESFSDWRNQNGKLCQKTLNEYQDAVSTFADWLMKNRRCLEANPLAFVERLSTVGNERFERRALSADEIERLLSVSGPRKEVYQVAIYLGLRRKEMGLLQWRDVDLERAKPCVSLRAATTKNRKAAVRRLHPVAVHALQRVKDSQPNTEPTDYVFADLLPSPTEMRKDLVLAGIPHDTENRVDFHSLRHTTDTLLVSQPNIAPRTAMEIMRHGSIDLTMKTYTDASLLPTEEAILSLPWLGEQAPEEKHTKSTHIRTHDLGAASRPMSQADANDPKEDGLQTVENKESAGLLTALVAFCRELGNGARCRVRTCDILRVKQALYH